MEKVEDKNLIEALESFFCAMRAGKLVRDTEEIERTWYINEEVGKYQAYVELHGHLTLLFSIAFEVIPHHV